MDPSRMLVGVGNDVKIASPRAIADPNRLLSVDVHEIVVGKYLLVHIRIQHYYSAIYPEVG
jgi:hypothetical protein